MVHLRFGRAVHDLQIVVEACRHLVRLSKNPVKLRVPEIQGQFE